MELEVEEEALIIPLELLRWAVSDSGGIKLGKKKKFISACFFALGSALCVLVFIRETSSNKKNHRRHKSKGGLSGAVIV